MRRNTSIALCLAVFSMGAIAWAQSVADRVPITYAVEHAHSTGSCKGELIIDKWRFAYTSTDRQEDSREWKLTDLKLGWESYGEGADTLWYDDVAVGSQRIGC